MLFHSMQVSEGAGKEGATPEGRRKLAGGTATSGRVGVQVGSPIWTYKTISAFGFPWAVSRRENVMWQIFPLIISQAAPLFGAPNLDMLAGLRAAS